MTRRGRGGGRARRRDRDRDPDGGGLLLLAMLVLAITLVISLGIMRVLEVGSHQLAGSSGTQPDLEIFLEARTAVIEEIESLPAGDRNVSYAQAFDRAISPLTKTAAAYSMELSGGLANRDNGWHTTEVSFTVAGTYHGLESTDGLPVAQGEPYDGGDDGLVHVNGEQVAVLVQLRLFGPEVELSELLVIAVG